MTALIVSNLFAWSIQVAVLITAAFLAVRLVRVEPPAVRHLFFRGVLVLCLLLPIVQPRLSVGPVPGGVAAGSIDGVRIAQAPEGQARGLLTESIGWPSALGLILAAGMVARLLWIGTGVLRLRKLRRAGEIATPTDEHLDLQRLITTRATIRYVRQLGQPVTFGFHRPVILLPCSLRDEAAPIQRAVLAHELWHVRRADWPWTVTEEALRAVCWFHPAIWALLSEIQATREEVVDELTVLTTGSRRTYVDALLVFADKSPWFAATAFARRRHLIHRLVLISKEAVMSARRVVASCVALAAVVISTGWYAVQAFPLKETVETAQVSSQTIGPVEERARPVTPENPIPRRTHYVPADYPADAASAGVRGLLTMRLAVDESGQVAEARTVNLLLHWKDGSLSANDMGPETLERLLNAQVNHQSVRPVVESIVAATTRAMRQWRYAPPADGPVAFNVSIKVGPPPPPAPPPAHAASPRPGMPPPPPPAPAPGEAGSTGFSGDAVRVGGNIKVPTKIRNVNPVYPVDAQVNRVQGVVIIEARIEADGTVGQVRVIRSIPMLDDAAVEAVRQWQFTPTLLDGQPVPVIMTTTVNFTLQ